jgi:hypothetical protein
MSNVNITSTNIEFTSTASGLMALIEPNWDEVDTNSFHLITEQGVFLISVLAHTINDNQYSTSQDAIVYLNSL